MTQTSFDAYNTFLWECELDRLTKILARHELFQRIADTPGDIVECGVFKGQGLLFWARMVQIFNPLSGRKVIGFDTFDGVPDSVTGPTDRKGAEMFRDYADVPERLMAQAERLGLADRIEIVAGDATETIPAYVAARPGFRIALLNLDFDVYEPTLAALEGLYDRVVGGGIVCLDEYAVHHWGESNAVDGFLAGRGIGLKCIRWALSPAAYFAKPA